ncbi:MAG: GGDEF domain-containing protein [Alphaproteobacteria bacterium]|nr:MAG: GGDEF domain-containing protein [Alphaproteobacteria bacterium]
MADMLAQDNSQQPPNPQTAEAWWRTQSATMALLKHAYKKIGDAEAELARREERIQTLEKMALTDEMTGLYNRRGFMSEFDRDMNRMKRQNEQGGLFVLFDLNKFKYINDTHGHIAGDKCLQLVGRTLLKLIRNTDMAARFGGDEFALFLSSTTPEHGADKAVFVRETLCSLVQPWKNTDIPIKTGMGTAYCAIGTPFEQVYEAADKALYADKTCA